MTRPLWDIFTEGHETPEGTRLFLKATRPDLRTRNGFRWPIQGRVESPPPEKSRRTTDPCPQFPGDGLSVAKTAKGMAQGGYSPSTVLIVAVTAAEILAEDAEKAKITGGLVLDLVDGLRIIREHGTGANLRGAGLGGAALGGASLRGASLRGAAADRWTVWPEGFDSKAAGVIGE